MSLDVIFNWVNFIFHIPAEFLLDCLNKLKVKILLNQFDRYLIKIWLSIFVYLSFIGFLMFSIDKHSNVGDFNDEQQNHLQYHRDNILKR